YWQALVTSPSCGGTNPLPCPASTEPGGRRTRMMIAKFTKRTPLTPTVVAPISDTVPWGTPYKLDSGPIRAHLPAGTFTLLGKKSGTAVATIKLNSTKTG